MKNIRRKKTTAKEKNENEFKEKETKKGVRNKFIRIAS